MSGFLLGLSTSCAGIFIGARTLNESPNDLRKNIRTTDLKIDRITKVAGNLLFIIGRLMIAAQLISIGAFVFSNAPAMGALASLSQALNLAYKPFIGALGAIGAGEVLRIIAD